MTDFPVENKCTWCQWDNTKRHFCLTEAILSGDEAEEDHFDENYQSCDCDGQHYR